MVWNSMNDVISICLKENQDKMTFSSPTRKIISERSNDSFVDNTAIGLTAQPLESPEGITTRMNVLANKYDKYLNLSGGRLAVHKCLWYFLGYKRRGDKIYPVTIKESPHLQVNITEAFSGKNIRIKRMDPSEAHKTLGVWLAIDGNSKKEVEFLQGKVNKWAMMTSAAVLSDKSRRLSYLTVLLPTIKYAAPVLTLSIKESRAVIKKALPIYLNASGLSRKTIVYRTRPVMLRRNQLF